jgi:hypothetical protein
VALALLAAAVIVLPGCAIGRSPQAATLLSRPPQAAGLPAGVVNAIAVPTAVPNHPALRRDVLLSSCRAARDGWQASGTALNPGRRQARYTITIFFTTTAGTVIGSGQTAVIVSPGTQRPWNVTAAFHPAHDTRCVLAGVG